MSARESHDCYARDWSTFGLPPVLLCRPQCFTCRQELWAFGLERLCKIKWAIVRISAHYREQRNVRYDSSHDEVHTITHLVPICEDCWQRLERDDRGDILPIFDSKIDCFLSGCQGSSILMWLRVHIESSGSNVFMIHKRVTACDRCVARYITNLAHVPFWATLP